MDKASLEELKPELPDDMYETTAAKQRLAQ